MPIPPPWMSSVPRPRRDEYGPGICSDHDWPTDHLLAPCPDCCAKGIEGLGFDPAQKHGQFTDRRLVSLQIGSRPPFWSWDPFPCPSS